MPLGFGGGRRRLNSRSAILGRRDPDAAIRPTLTSTSLLLVLAGLDQEFAWPIPWTDSMASMLFITKV